MMWSARRLAWSLWILTLVVTVVGLALMVWDWSAPVPAAFSVSAGSPACSRSVSAAWASC